MTLLSVILYGRTRSQYLCYSVFLFQFVDRYLFFHVSSIIQCLKKSREELGNHCNWAAA